MSESNKNWSFLKYLDRFICSSHVVFPPEELVSLLLLVFGICLLSRNDSSLEAFITLILNASNNHVNRYWQPCLLLTLQFIKKQSCPMNDPFWIKVLQLLKAESCSSFSTPKSNFMDCFSGTIIGGSDELKSFSDCDFQEDLSIEQDAIVQSIFSMFDDSPFNQFIQKQGGSFRLGPHFVVEPESHPAPVKQTSKPVIDLDESIQTLQEKLKHLETNDSRPATPTIDISLSTIIVDTNALIANDHVLQDELISTPSRFVIPLIVLAEIEKIKDNAEREYLATSAMAILDPLIQSERLAVVNNFGRILRPLEIKQQCEAFVMSLALDNRVNDDVILDLVPTFRHQRPLLLTDDINMRLKAKTRNIESISVKEFRTLCNR